MDFIGDFSHIPNKTKMIKIQKLLLAMAMALPLVLYNQSIPNNGFENWETFSATGTMEPLPWITSNIQGAVSGIAANVSRSTDAYKGNYSMRLETVAELGGGPFIGAATLYSELNGKPQQLRGYYKGSILGNDDAGIAIFIKSNSVLVGAGDIEFDGSQDDFTFFELDIEYFLPMEPDTMSIIILNAVNAIGTVGTTIYLDDLSFDISSSTNPDLRPEPAVKIFPNPARNTITVDLPYEVNDIFFIIYDSNGAKLKAVPMKGTSRVDISMLPAGIYVFEIRNRLSELLESGRFFVQ